MRSLRLKSDARANESRAGLKPIFDLIGLRTTPKVGRPRLSRWVDETIVLGLGSRVCEPDVACAALRPVPYRVGIAQPAGDPRKDDAVGLARSVVVAQGGGHRA
jgi:hypothetical protein